MGILKNGILGGFSKKVGTVSGRSHMGQDLISALPRKQNTPATAKQSVAREKLGLLSGFLTNIKQLVDSGFSKFTKKKSALNAAFKYNYNHAFMEQDQTLTLNFPELVYSRGPVTIANCPAINMSDDNRITFSWLPEQENEFTRRSDKASFLICSAGLNRQIICMNAARRDELQFEAVIDPDYTGTEIHCYISFCSESDQLAGDSFYIGKV